MDTLTKPHSLFPQLKEYVIVANNLISNEILYLFVFWYFSGCDSETDTEEFEKVCRSPIEKRIQNPVTEQTKQTVDTCTSTTSIQPTPQSSEMYTSCTALTETCNAETLTEVRNHSDNIMLSKFHSTNTLTTTNQLLSMKKPARKSMTIKKSVDNMLPSIPEVFSPVIQNDETTTLSDDISVDSKPNSDNDLNVGHHEAKHSENANNLNHNEFIDSEFYIEESLPSSLNSDNDSFTNDQSVDIILPSYQCQRQCCMHTCCHRVADNEIQHTSDVNIDPYVSSHVTEADALICLLQVSPNFAYKTTKLCQQISNIYIHNMHNTNPELLVYI